MQNEQEFYRCLVSDAAGRTLKKILAIIRDDTLSDEICFHKIEAIISLYEELGISTGSRHEKSTRAFRLRPGPPTTQRPGASVHAFGNQPPEAGAAARKHRYGNTIPNPDGPPIVPFPRKRAALSAPGGALVLSPLEPPPGDEGRGRKNQPPRGRRARDEDKTGNGPGSA